LFLEQEIDEKYGPKAIESVHNHLLKLKKLEDETVRGCFEWIDGLLITAIERGDWILLDNVNLCSSAVLDRLNPLLEPGGSITVNERGISFITIIRFTYLLNIYQVCWMERHTR